MTTSTLSLDDLIALAQPDARAVADGRRRMTDLWHDRPTDSLPILFSAAPPEGIAWNSDMQRHVEDPEQMLYDSVAGLVGLALSGSDAQPAIRVNSGTGTLATVAGCRQITSEYGLPWTTHVSRVEAEAFDPAENPASKGVLPRVRELYAQFRARLPEYIYCYIADTQSPFDLAHLILGDDLFFALHDEPEFVHALLEKTTALYIEGTRLMKSWIGEPLDGGYHGNLALANGGARSCEDTSTLLSPAQLAEFVLPYQRRGLEAFGGGWVHYCGNNAGLLAGVLANPAARGLNFGNPERHDFAIVIPALIQAGKCYVGGIPRGDEETLEAYFRRVIGYTGGTRKGLIFTPELRGDEPREPARVLETWHALQ